MADPMGLEKEQNGKALFRRRLKVDGSKSKAMKLESLLHACQAEYPELAEDTLGGG